MILSECQIRSELLHLIDKALGRLIYVPALERYTSYLIEMLPYRDIVDDDFEIDTPQAILESSDDEASYEVTSLLYSAISLVNISIAQQSLISGESILHLIDRVIKRGPVDPMYYNTLTMLKENSLLSKNYLSYSLRGTFKYARNDDQQSSYDELLKSNLKLYNDFQENGSSCRYENESYKDCTHDFPSKVQTGFIFDRGTVLFKDKNGHDLRLALPDSDFIEKGMVEHSPYLFRLIVLRDKLYEMAYRNSGSADVAIHSNFYAN